MVSTLNDNLLKAFDFLFSSGPPVGLGLKGDSYTCSFEGGTS